MNLIIAVDGPSGSGKSTIAKIVAEKRDLIYIDTGAMYRAVTLSVMREELTEEEITNDFLQTLKINFNSDGNICLNGEDVSDIIKTEKVTVKTPPIAKLPIVREYLVDKQRKIAQSSNVILDGRDIGTVVFPNATLKIYLDASVEIRAKRRFEEYKQRKEVISFGEVLENVAKRDKIDKERKFGPLRVAEDAIIIDSSNMSIDEVAQKIIYLIGERVKYCGRIQYSKN